MIQEFVDSFIKNKHKLRDIYSNKDPEDYEEVVRNVVKLINDDLGDLDSPHPDSIKLYECGFDCCGDYVFLMSDKYRDKSDWISLVKYGSCSSCDTLERIKAGQTPNLKVDDYITLSLHIVQSITPIKRMNDEL